MRSIFIGVITIILASCTPAPEDAPSNETKLDVATIHKQALVLDAHADTVIASTPVSYIGADGKSKVSPEKLSAGGVDAVVMSIAVGPGPRTAEADQAAYDMAIEKLGAIDALLANHSDQFVLTKTSDEIRAAEKTGKTALILGFQNARALKGSADTIDEFYDAGIRVFALNHLGHNDFSDSSRPIYHGETGEYEVTEEHGGLSPLGVAAIERINALGGVIDVSQMSKSATLQAINLSNSPVIASHSNVQKITNVTRNLSDEEIDLIGDKGGVIHIGAFGAYLVDLSEPETLEAIINVRRKHGLPDVYSYPYELYWELADSAAQYAFLTEMRETIGRGNIADMIAHIDYILKRIGIDHVGIGNDFNHGGGIEGYNDASEAQNLTAALVAHGYSENDIRKIWSENFLRVLEQAEQYRE